MHCPSATVYQLGEQAAPIGNTESESEVSVIEIAGEDSNNFSLITCDHFSSVLALGWCSFMALTWSPGLAYDK